MLKLGLNHVSNADYHADKSYLSSSIIKLLVKDVAEFEHQYIKGNKRAPASLDILNEGSLTHTMLLEPHLLDKEFIAYQGARRQGEAYAKFSLENQGKTIVTKAQWSRAEQLRSAFMKMEDYRPFLEGGAPELSLCQMLHDVPVKVRFDYINVDKGFISDIKTTSYPGDLESFKLVAENLDYPLSGALYSRVAELFYGKRFDFYFIVLSKRDLTANIYKLSDKTRQKAERKIFDALRKYKKCLETGIWKESELKWEPNFEILEL